MHGKPHCNSDRPARRLFWLAGLTGAVALALAPLSFHVERRLDTAVRLKGSESDYVAQQLATRFRSPFVDRVVLVIQGLPPADSEEGAQALTQIVGALKGPDISGIVSRLDLPDPIFLGRGGGTFVLIGLAPVNGLPESLVPRIRQQARMHQDQFRNRYPAVKLELTGELPLNFDLRTVSSSDVKKGESLVLPVTLALTVAAGIRERRRRPDPLGGWPTRHLGGAGRDRAFGSPLAPVHPGSEFGGHAGAQSRD